MATRMQQRRGTAAQWTAANPTLAAGEIGFETDTVKFKVGNGSSAWASLKYFTDAESILGGLSGIDLPATLDTLNELAAAMGDNPAFLTTIATNLTNHATDTTDIHGITNTADLVTTTILSNHNTDTSNVHGITDTLVLATLSGTQTLTNKTFVTPLGITASDVGLGSVNNTTDANKPVSTATQTALDFKANLDSPTFIGTVNLPSGTVTSGMIAEGTIVTADIADTAVTAGKIGAEAVTTAKIADQAVTNAKIATGAVTKDMVGLADADNTSDANKPISSDTQTALDLKSPLASPTFTGTVSGITKAMVDLGNVDNTSDVNKPVSTAAQAALDLKANLASPTFTGTVTLPTGTVTSGMILDGAIVNADINESAAIAQSKISGLTDDLSSKLALAGGTMTGALTLSADPSSSLHAATKQYVDNTASGVIAKPQVLGATTANIDATYNNGTAGVGATLTHNTNGAFPAESGGASGWALYKGILVKNQTNKAQNGRYYVSDMGSASTPYVLTRCTYCDEASEIPGAYIFVQDGTFAGTGWIQVVADPATFVVGTDNIDVFQFSGSGTITAGTGVTVSGNEVSISTGAITSSLILDGTIVDADVNASAAIAQSKISGLTSDLAAKAPIASPTFTGTVSGVTKSMVGLGSVDNTADADKPVSTATHTVLGYKAPLHAPTFTGSVTIPAGASISGYAPLASPTFTGEVTIPTGASISGYAPLSSPAFSGTVSGISATMVGLGNVENTSDANKPVSTATQTALDLKLASSTAANTYAPLASPIFTGVGITVPAGGVQFTDGTQTKEGVPSRTTIIQKTAGYTLAALNERDSLIEVSSATGVTVTIPTNATTAFPIGSSIDILQTGAGQVTIAGAVGVTVNATPGLKLRTQWSSATLMKRATDSWVVVGDLTA